MKKKKQTTKKQYKILAMVWMLAASAMTVAFIRRLAEFNLFLLLLLALSLLLAAGFWKSYKNAPEEHINYNKSEEKNHE